MSRAGSPLPVPGGAEQADNTGARRRTAHATRARLEARLVIFLPFVIGLPPGGGLDGDRRSCPVDGDRRPLPHGADGVCTDFRMDPARVPEGTRDRRLQSNVPPPGASVRSGVSPRPLRRALRKVSSAGLEPAACCLGGSRSIHLSYEDDNHCQRVRARLLSGRSVAGLSGGRTGLCTPSIPLPRPLARTA